MPGDTRIEWADKVWNPQVGCTKVSLGCLHCYAEALDMRFYLYRKDEPGERAGPFVPWTKAAQKKASVSAVRLHPERLDAPLHWKKPQRVFVNSMSDLFHENVPDGFIGDVFTVMSACEWHTFLVLTKRPERALAVLGGNWLRPFMEAGQYPFLGDKGRPFHRHEYSWRLQKVWPLPNVQIGVSIENQETADERLPVLAKVPATVRFVSLEPLLGPIDLGHASPCGYYCDSKVGHIDHPFWTPGVAAPIQWAIIGGESGPNHRPMELAWLENIVRQCDLAGTKVFVKQDSGPRPGMQGRILDALWARKELPCQS